MSKRRANGEGNIRKRADGRWEGRYTVGYHPETGKQVFKSVLAKTQSEVKRKLKLAIEKAENVDTFKSEKYTLGAWMEIWFENYAKIKVRPSSHATYKGYIKNHIKPKIGKIKLSKLSSLDLQKFYKQLLEDGRINRIESQNQAKGLSAKTVRNIHQIISTALDVAKSQKLIMTNPAEHCALPRVEHFEMKTLTVGQLENFFNEAKKSGVFEMYYVEIVTGLRRGELLGLKWSDIDFKDKILRI
ncbi:MAG: site-specific integrase, partial [Clostridia bacterium]